MRSRILKEITVFSFAGVLENMEVCDYQCPDHDANSMLSHLASHPQESLTQLPGPIIPLSSTLVDQIVILDSSRIAMQIASGQIIWPILPKPKEAPKLDSDVHSFHPYPNGTLPADMESPGLMLAQSDIPAEKCKVRKRPKSCSDDIESQDGDMANEKPGVMRWKDEWVVQLIHVRGRMQAAFSGTQKQRIDLWQVIKNEMMNSCYGFDKDSEACRKKWRRVYKEYKDDKHARLAGSNNSNKSKFYDLIDAYMGERPIDDCEPSMLLTSSKSVKEEALENSTVHNSGIEGSLAVVCHDDYIVTTNAMKRPVRRGKRQTDATSSSSLQSLLSELLSIGKEMLQTTRQFEQEKLDVLSSLREALQEVAKKI